MAEYIAGSEDAFVDKMNQKAKELHMLHTHFVNCCGLDADGHETTAMDIALMSRELTRSYPKIFDYTTIWMDTITHVTARGSSEFGLSNTNKLLKSYEGANGLKTGSTSKAGFCLSATATRNNIALIAVVMNCKSSADRLKAAASLLDYGFSLCHFYEDTSPPSLNAMPVSNGTKDTVLCKYKNIFSYVSTKEIPVDSIKKTFSWKTNLMAPVKKGDLIGTLVYSCNNEKLGSVPIIATESIKKASYSDQLKKLFQLL